MVFTILTLFPEFFTSPLQTSILGRAIKQGKIKVNIVNIRDFATDKHKVADDTPYGGGAGMVMKPEPVIRAIKNVQEGNPNAWVIMLSPQGRVFSQTVAKELSQKTHLVFVCGHYEGIDERVRLFVDDDISLGDFVLSGGEPAALCIVDAVARLVPGVVGKWQSVEEDSFSHGLLEYPQYTRPLEYEGYKVPEILLSGHHQRIREWRRKQALLRTLILRPDLLFSAQLSKEDKAFLKKICEKVICAVSG
jgi:tRNA (guanine37-N1)-methyltransferase